MNSPRQLLIGIAVALLVVAVQTWRYPPEFLAFVPLWIALALAGAVSCLVAARNPSRSAVSVSGALVVTASAARGFGLVLDWIRGAEDTSEAGFIVGAVAWWMVALLAYISWREYVLPWSVGKEPRR